MATVGVKGLIFASTTERQQKAQQQINHNVITDEWHHWFGLTRRQQTVQ